ncbi:MAG: hypothetical protein GY791_19925 [Alphaproteobacteria bacterium]|nr:hypothetical protein [Alphaproteobacteria bacterium]
MVAKVLVIGLDAADAPTLETAARGGDLPTLARLQRSAGTARLANCA